MRRTAFVILWGFIAMQLSGCAGKLYDNTLRPAYQGVEKAVTLNWDLIPEKYKKPLRKFHELATRYDKTRSVVKPALEDAIKGAKKQEKLDATLE